MGAYSTIDITREGLIALIMSQLFKAHDEQLAFIAFELFGEKTLNNFCVVHGYSGSDREYPSNEWRFY